MERSRRDTCIMVQGGQSRGWAGAGLSVTLIYWILMVLFTFPYGAWAGDRPSFFKSREVMSNNIQPFNKWNEMVLRYKTEDVTQDTGCGGVHEPACKIAPWKKFLMGQHGKSRMEQIHAVNSYANQHPYIIDPVNWRMEDYWTTLKQFLIKDGDCEDYAITKFFSLKSLGFKNDDMRIVILKDTNLNVMHAILVVFDSGNTWVLDNQIKQVVEDDRIYHYIPLYSINETHWWRHRAS